MLFSSGRSGSKISLSYNTGIIVRLFLEGALKLENKVSDPHSGCERGGPVTDTLCYSSRIRHLSIDSPSTQDKLRLIS